MILVIIRTLILYIAVVVLLRIMGKRQIGQLQPYELVVIIMISELAAIPMQNTGIPIINGLIPIFILFASEVLLSFISLKSEKARGVICGKPSVLIENSRIVESELRRLRYNINDLLEQLRLKNVPDIKDVEFAILETSGQLSVILKSDQRPVEPHDLNIMPAYEGLPVTVVIDGRVIETNLKKTNYDLKWLQSELKKSGIKNVKDVLFAGFDTGGKFIHQAKTVAQKNE
ncbi:MAG TPA: DUF421 domain-containing protein [Syntrophomonadaceae bacterium]|nr:DUF421 domain-containing protein [Syntrophomonadaceae bacterium]